MAVKENMFPQSGPVESGPAGSAKPIAAEDQALPVRRITAADLKDAVRLGWADFIAKPSHLVFIAIIYPLAGIFLAQLTVSYDIFPLLFPLMAGFALVGPFAAIGLYEISRRREKGQDSSWLHAFGVRRSPAIGSILVLGALLTGIFMAWLVAAYMIYNLTFQGVVPVSLSEFIREVLTTQRGWVLILIGNGVGLIFAIAAFSLSVVSFPLLLDRKVSLPAAIRTSISAVRHNPVTLMLWGLFIALALVVGSLPLFVGLAIVMPVLAHASWHVYRKVVA